MYLMVASGVAQVAECLSIYLMVTRDQRERGDWGQNIPIYPRDLLPPAFYHPSIVH
jgi:hypothetical protein